MAFFFAATLSACGQKTEQTQEAAPSATPPSASTTPSAAQPASTDNGIIADIKDALTGSAVLKCDYTDQDGTKSTVHLKGKMVLIESTMNGKESVKINGLVRDNKMYIWSGESTAGFVIDFSKIKPSEATMKMGDTQIHSSDDVVNELEKKKENCTKESLPDSAFDVPTSVKWNGAQGQ